MKGLIILILIGLIIGAGCVSQTKTTTPTPPAGNTANNMPPTTSQIVEVNIQGLSFVPSAIQLNAGQTLRFVNNSGFAHDVHIKKDGADVFPRTQINAGQSLDVKISDAGNYELICDRHAPGMEGTITAT